MTSLRKCNWAGQVTSLDHFIHNTTIALESVTELDVDISNESMSESLKNFSRNIIALLKRFLENIKQTIKALFAKLGVGVTIKDLTDLIGDIRKSREINFSFLELKKLTKLGWNVEVKTTDGKKAEYTAKDLRNGYDAYATATLRMIDFLRQARNIELMTDHGVAQMMSAIMDDTYMLFGAKPTRFVYHNNEFGVIHDEIIESKTLMPFAYQAHVAEDDINYLIEIMKRYEITGPSSKFIERNIDLSLKCLSDIDDWIDESFLNRDHLRNMKRLISDVFKVTISDVSVSLVRGIHGVYRVYSKAVRRLKYSDKTE